MSVLLTTCGVVSDDDGCYWPDSARERAAAAAGQNILVLLLRCFLRTGWIWTELRPHAPSPVLPCLSWPGAVQCSRCRAHRLQGRTSYLHLTGEKITNWNYYQSRISIKIWDAWEVIMKQCIRWYRPLCCVGGTPLTRNRSGPPQHSAPPASSQWKLKVGWWWWRGASGGGGGRGHPVPAPAPPPAGDAPHGARFNGQGVAVSRSSLETDTKVREVITVQLGTSM